MSTQIGAQMFTLHEHLKTVSDTAKACAKVKEMGYGAIQASAGAFGTMTSKELKQILDDTGLVCAATHFSMERLSEVDAIVDFHAEVGCKYTAVGGFGWGGVPKEEWMGFIAEYNALGKQLAAKGLHLGYHNHSHELAPFATDPAKLCPGECPYQLLFDELDESVWFELDTFWITHGGGSPEAWIKKFEGRLPCLHVKDMTVTGGRDQKMCEVGSGNLNWPGILEAAKAAGVQWYLVERDSGDLDPFDSLKISLENLHTMGIQ